MWKVAKNLDRATIVSALCQIPEFVSDEAFDNLFDEGLFVAPALWTSKDFSREHAVGAESLEVARRITHANVERDANTVRFHRRP